MARRGGAVRASRLRARREGSPALLDLVPALRMVVVAGPRIDPDSLPKHDGLDVRAYVPELHRHLAVCDLAVVQGGLTTTMELTASGKPFLYFPLRHHFEQNFHVRHRLERYGAGRCLDYDTAGPGEIAAAIAAEIGRKVDYQPVATDGAARVGGGAAGVYVCVAPRASEGHVCTAAVRNANSLHAADQLVHVAADSRTR